MDTNYLLQVKEQYEALPYPPRNPQDERERLQVVDFDFLGKISHFCFSGNAVFKNGFRALVAGGGTGDSAIFLAEQLRDTDARIVYVDLSQASMDIAQRRAKERGLQNIEWHILSILDLPSRGFDKFDYINCSGVLHHLADPIAGLKSLSACLKETGCMGIMVYGRFGRTSVYHTQELLRIINADVVSMTDRIVNTRKIIRSLPTTNWLKSGPFILHNVDNLTDSDLYDLFLHSQDRAYTVPELYQWIAECDLKLLDFVSNKASYQPESYITDTDLLSKIKLFPLPVQQAIGEIMTGSLNTHVFYVAKRTCVAPSLTDDTIPYFCDILPIENQQLYDQVRHIPPNCEVSLAFPNSRINIKLNLGKFGKYLFKYINGDFPTRKILQKVITDPNVANLRPQKKHVEEELNAFYKIFHRHNLLLLKKRNSFRFKTYADMQFRKFGDG